MNKVFMLCSECAWLCYMCSYAQSAIPASCVFVIPAVSYSWYWDDPSSAHRKPHSHLSSVASAMAKYELHFPSHSANSCLKEHIQYVSLERLVVNETNRHHFALCRAVLGLPRPFRIFSYCICEPFQVVRVGGCKRDAIVTNVWLVGLLSPRSTAASRWAEKKRRAALMWNVAISNLTSVLVC